MNEIPDEKDFAIMDELKKNSRLSEQKLAKKTGIAMTTVHNRIKKLREAGIVEAYTIRLNYAKLGKPLTAFVLLKAIHEADQKQLLDYISKIPGVYEVAMITGEFDLLFKARVASMEELNKIVVQGLRRQKTVGETKTMICYDIIEKV
ncbi:MAG: Lrp/AsnC family transcriptional regulator [Candidatus Micrarchaeota archaeon]